MIVALLAACDSDGKPPADSTAGADAPFVETLTANSLHILASSTPVPGDPGHSITEYSAALDPGWTLDLSGEDGTSGTVRQANGNTVFVSCALPPDYSSTLAEVDPAGNLLWSEDDFFAGEFAFAHGLAMTPAGDFLIVDTVMARILAVDPQGELIWELSLTTDGGSRLPNGLALTTDADGVSRIAVTELAHADPQACDRVQVFRLGSRTEVPTVEWTYTAEPGSAGRLWPHGPRFLADGSLLVSFAALGQIAHFVDGAPVTVVPPVAGMLAYPRDVLVLPDGTWLIADGGAELLRIYDPYGRFELVDMVPAPGIFGLAAVVCGPDGGLPCLPGAQTPP